MTGEGDPAGNPPPEPSREAGQPAPTAGRRRTSPERSRRRRAGSGPSPGMRALGEAVARMGRRLIPEGVRPLLLPAACAVAIATLAASEFMTMFEFSDIDGRVLETQTGGARHGYALVVLSGFALIALSLTIATGRRPPAVALAAVGVVALAIFLLGDAPRAGTTGELDLEGVPFTSEASPAAGFWLALLGAAGLAAAGLALATAGPERLRAIAQTRPGRSRKSEEPLDYQR